jgi:hypothetical protein
VAGIKSIIATPGYKNTAHESSGYAGVFTIKKVDNHAL